MIQKPKRRSFEGSVRTGASYSGSMLFYRKALIAAITRYVVIRRGVLGKAKVRYEYVDI